MTHFALNHGTLLRTLLVVKIPLAVYILCQWIQNFEIESFGNISLGKRVGARMMTVFNVCICLFKK